MDAAAAAAAAPFGRTYGGMLKHLATLQTMKLAGCEVDAGEPHSEDQPCAMRLLVADGWNAASRRWHTQIGAAGPFSRTSFIFYTTPRIKNGSRVL